MQFKAGLCSSNDEAWHSFASACIPLAIIVIGNAVSVEITSALHTAAERRRAGRMDILMPPAGAAITAVTRPAVMK
jgi:hypothetical protein